MSLQNQTARQPSPTTGSIDLERFIDGLRDYIGRELRPLVERCAAIEKRLAVLDDKEPVIDSAINKQTAELQSLVADQQKTIAALEKRLDGLQTIVLEDAG